MVSLIFFAVGVFVIFIALLQMLMQMYSIWIQNSWFVVGKIDSFTFNMKWTGFALYLTFGSVCLALAHNWQYVLETL